MSLPVSVRRHPRVSRVYVGAVGVQNLRFQPALEDPSSSQFANLALVVEQQVRE